MHSIKLFFLAALTLGVASTTAFTGVSSTSLRLEEGQTTTPPLSCVILYPHVDQSYQAVYAPQLVVAAPMLAPVNPLLPLGNTSCGMEDEAVEMAKLQGTSPVRPVANHQEMVIKPAYVSAYDQGPAKLLSWGSEVMKFFYLDNTRSKNYHHRRFLPKGQWPFGLSDASPYLSKTGAGLTGSVAVTWAVAFPEETCKLISMMGAAARPHWAFLLLLLVFVLALSTVLNMEHTAPAEKKDQVYLIETLESGEEEGAAAEQEGQEEQQQSAEALLKAQNSLAEAKEKGAAGPWDVVVNHFEKVCRTLQRAESLRLFEEEGLVGTVLAMLLGAEDEGAEAVPPFFKKMVPRQMTKAEWTWNVIKGRYAVVLKPLPARVDTAPSTPTFSVAGGDERDRSESVLPRAAASSSINIDGAVGVVAAPKPKKVGKMTAFRAGWKRIFRIRKKSSSPRVTVSSFLGGMA